MKGSPHAPPSRRPRRPLLESSGVPRSSCPRGHGDPAPAHGITSTPAAAYLLRGRSGREPPGAGQEDVRLRLPAPHFGVIAEDDVMEQAEEALVPAGLHLEGRGP